MTIHESDLDSILTQLILELFEQEQSRLLLSSSNNKKNPEQTNINNEMLILNKILNSKRVTRAEMAKNLGISRTTLWKRIKEKNSI